MEEVMKVMRQAKQGEHLHFYLKMHFKRLKKCVFWLVQTRLGCVVPLANVRERRCDYLLLVPQGYGLERHRSS